MSNSSVFISENIHQGHERFSDISRGRQCSFISFLALLCVQDLPIEEWTATTVDHILVEGDRLYLDALESRSIPDTETLSLNYLPDCQRVRPFGTPEGLTRRQIIEPREDMYVRKKSQKRSKV